MQTPAALILGIAVVLAAAAGAVLLGNGLIEARSLDRTVEVKGLAEREVPADTAIWPVQFIVAGDALEALLVSIEAQTTAVLGFLEAQGFEPGEITIGAPVITDRLAQQYGGERPPVRFTVAQVITVFTPKVEAVRAATRELLGLGKDGIVVTQTSYELRTEYLFNGLNDIKPAMVEEATRNAREVALKFAADSGSRLGRIKSARQGQFSISDRDSNTPHVKRVRIVSTLEYYLVD